MSANKLSTPNPCAVSGVRTNSFGSRAVNCVSGPKPVILKPVSLSTLPPSVASLELISIDAPFSFLTDPPLFIAINSLIIPPPDIAFISGCSLGSGSSGGSGGLISGVSTFGEISGGVGVGASSPSAPSAPS